LNYFIQSNQSVLLPEILGCQSITDGVILTLCIPETLSYFIGHFEQIAIVPGVVQIQWAVHYAQAYLGLNAAFSRMEAVKFKELLLPGQLFELELRYYVQPYKLVFSCRSEIAEYSSGRIYFHG
jgi:3-hydroxymyristoyl/3-hydroxydecanoyl-(acyl carrier protein) dehydratase